jgi:hypothetical protein
MDYKHTMYSDAYIIQLVRGGVIVGTATWYMGDSVPYVRYVRAGVYDTPRYVAFMQWSMV